MKWEDVIVSGAWGYKTDLLDLRTALNLEQDLWVRIIPAVWLPLGIQQESQRIQDQVVDASTDEKIELMKSLVAKVVVEWNLPDLEQPGKILPIPAKSITSLDQVPGRIIMEIVEKAQEDSGDIPLVNESPSMESSSHPSQSVPESVVVYPDGQLSLL